MSGKPTGGCAFPESYVGADAPHEGIGNGMTLHDYFAAHAPISFADALELMGNTFDMNRDIDRAAVLSVLALMCSEYADFALQEREK